MPRLYGDRGTCVRCGLDIVFYGRAIGWRDQRGNKRCPQHTGPNGQLVSPRRRLIHTVRPAGNKPADERRHALREAGYRAFLLAVTGPPGATRMIWRWFILKEKTLPGPGRMTGGHRTAGEAWAAAINQPPGDQPNEERPTSRDEKGRIPRVSRSRPRR